MARHNHVQNSTINRKHYKKPLRTDDRARSENQIAPKERELIDACESVIEYSTSEFRIENAPQIPDKGEEARSKFQRGSVKNLKQYVSKGKVYRYHYPSRIPIMSELGTPEFEKEMAEAETEYRRRSIAANGSLGHALELYKGHNRFPDFNTAARSYFVAVIKWLPQEFSGTTLAKIDNSFARRFKKRAYEARGSNFSNAAQALLLAVVSWSVEQGMLASDKIALDVPGRMHPNQRRNIKIF